MQHAHCGHNVNCFLQLIMIMYPWMRFCIAFVVKMICNSSRKFNSLIHLTVMAMAMRTAFVCLGAHSWGWHRGSDILCAPAAVP